MKVSIITATRNNASTLESTIKSVLWQSYKNIEYIIIDGASSDGSIDIIKRYTHQYPHIIKYVSESDSGVYSAINKGIAMATGDIVGLLHGNDEFSSYDVVEQVVAKFGSTNASFLYGDVKYRTLDGKIVRYYSSDNFAKEKLLQGIAPPHPSLYMRRDLFYRYGFYKEDYLIGADFDMFLRLMVVNDLCGEYLPLDMVTMSVGGLSTRLYHRIFTNNREKYRALKENSCNVNVFLLLKRYLCTLKSFRKKTQLRNAKNK